MFQGMAESLFDEVVTNEVRRLQSDELRKLGGDRGQALSGPVDDIPVPENRKRFNIEDLDPLGFEFAVEGMDGDHAEAKALFDTLLDGGIAVHLHADIQLDAAICEKSLDGIACSGADFSHDKRPG